MLLGGLLMWGLTQHVCVRCLGRILVSQTHIRCADCGLEAERSHGPNPAKPLCACGAMLRTGVSAGLRCVPNPDGATAECPAEIVVQYVGNPDKQHREIKLKDGGGVLFDE